MGEQSQPPSGGDVSRGLTLIVLCAVLGFISTMITIIRVIVRAFSRQLGWDDVVISATSAFLIISEVFNGLEYQSGYGRHIAYLTPEQIEDILEWFLFIQIFLYLAIGLTKVSICLSSCASKGQDGSNGLFTFS